MKIDANTKVHRIQKMSIKGGNPFKSQTNLSHIHQENRINVNSGYCDTITFATAILSGLKRANLLMTNVQFIPLKPSITLVRPGLTFQNYISCSRSVFTCFVRL